MPDALPRGAAFLGSDAVAARCLSVLAARVVVPLVVTPPDRRRGRRGQTTPTPVRVVAEELGLPVLATADVNADASLATLVAAGPRLLAVVAFGQLLRRPVLDSAPLGGVNLHFSLLPRWRGAAPVQRAILAGDPVTGVAVQRVVRRLDAGPVLALREEPIGPTDDTPALMQRLAEVGAPLLADVIETLLSGAPITETVQDEASVTRAGKIDKAEGALDFATEDGAALDRRVRAFGDWPGCLAVFERARGDGSAVRVRRATPEDGPSDAAPGTVLAASAEGIVVKAREGALRIHRLQRAGGKELDAGPFLNGWAVAPGDQVVAPSSRSSAS